MAGKDDPWLVASLTIYGVYELTVATTVFRNMYEELKPVIFVGRFVLHCVFVLNMRFVFGW